MTTPHPLAWCNGALVASDAIELSPFQAGVLTGWGLFSTLRIYGGVPFAWEDHWARLCADGSRLHVEVAHLEAEVSEGLARLVESNAAREAVARVYFIRNHGALLDAPRARPTDALVFTRPLKSWGASAKLRLLPHGRHAQSPLAGTKTLTWAHNLVLVEEANAAGFDDVLLLNERGEVAECTAANIFVGRGGRLLTPPLDAGALPGVSRKILLRAASRHGLEIAEGVLYPDDLMRAEEIFITSSTREVQPVTQIGEWPISLGPLTQAAAVLFRQEIAAYTTAHGGA